MKNKKIFNLALIFVIVFTLSLLMFHSQNDQLNLLENDLVYAFPIDSTIITVDYPHSGNGIECTSCHEPHILLGEISSTVVGTGNLCISCHNPISRGGDRPFSRRKYRHELPGEDPPPFQELYPRHLHNHA